MALTCLCRRASRNALMLSGIADFEPATRPSPAAQTQKRQPRRPGYLRLPSTQPRAPFVLSLRQAELAARAAGTYAPAIAAATRAEPTMRENALMRFLPLGGRSFFCDP